MSWRDDDGANESVSWDDDADNESVSWDDDADNESVSWDDVDDDSDTWRGDDDDNDVSAAARTKNDEFVEKRADTRTHTRKEGAAEVLGRLGGARAQLDEDSVAQDSEWSSITLDDVEGINTDDDDYGDASVVPVANGDELEPRQRMVRGGVAGIMAVIRLLLIFSYFSNFGEVSQAMAAITIMATMGDISGLLLGLATTAQVALISRDITCPGPRNCISRGLRSRFTQGGAALTVAIAGLGGTAAAVTGMAGYGHVLPGNVGTVLPCVEGHEITMCGGQMMVLLGLLAEAGVVQATSVVSPFMASLRGGEIQPGSTRAKVVRVGTLTGYIAGALQLGTSLVLAGTLVRGNPPHEVLGVITTVALSFANVATGAALHAQATKNRARLGWSAAATVASGAVGTLTGFTALPLGLAAPGDLGKVLALQFGSMGSASLGAALGVGLVLLDEYAKVRRARLAEQLAAEPGEHPRIREIDAADPGSEAYSDYYSDSTPDTDAVDGGEGVGGGNQPVVPRPLPPFPYAPFALPPTTPRTMAPAASIPDLPPLLPQVPPRRTPPRSGQQPDDGSN